MPVVIQLLLTFLLIEASFDFSEEPRVPVVIEIYKELGKLLITVVALVCTSSSIVPSPTPRTISSVLWTSASALFVQEAANPINSRGAAAKRINLFIYFH